ncbi:hypothetical protein T10_3261 [Trichinella papuae]|uniref:Uncharacterized protein n=1 Tax=Trichinella papuae TaxID=268474 RepID=A0A0V1LZ93_9BILA|nr:hypothetical protein T10_3261 [Trichinella papuae]
MKLRNNCYLNKSLISAKNIVYTFFLISEEICCQQRCG